MSKATPKRNSLPRNLLLVAIVVVMAYFAFKFSGAPEMLKQALVGSEAPMEINGPLISSEALEFPLESMDGEILRLEDFEGDVIMLTYWASWCITCRQTNPTIQTLATELSHRDDIRFLLMSLDNVQQNAIDYLESARFTIPNVFPGRSLPSPLNSAGVPTTYVVDKKGQIVYRYTGYSNYSRTAFRQWIEDVADRS